MVHFRTACKSFALQLLLQLRWNLSLRAACCCAPSGNLAGALALFASSVCSGAVNKEIDDKVVEKRQLDRTARHEWQRARSAFTAKNVAPSRELAMPGRCAKPARGGGRGVWGLYRGFLLDFFLACVFKARFPLFRIVTPFFLKKTTLWPLENKHRFGGDRKISVDKFWNFCEWSARTFKIPRCGLVQRSEIEIPCS